jgi:hypothetical protein
MTDGSEEVGITDQRLEEMRSVADKFDNSDGIFEFLQLVENGESNEFGIVPIAYSRTNSRFEEVTSDEKDALLFQIDQIIGKDKPYLIVTPEYSLYSRPKEAEPLVINDSGHVESGQGQVADAVERVMTLAKENDTTIVLGSVCEKKNLDSGREIALNTTLIVRSDGVIDSRRKTEDVFLHEGDEWKDVSVEVMTLAKGGSVEDSESLLVESEREQILDLTLGSLKTYPVPNNEGGVNNIAVLVCHERNVPQLYDRISDNVDTLVAVVSEGGGIRNRDIKAVATYGETELIHSNLKKRIGEKPVTIVETNERGRFGSVVSVDGDGNAKSARIWR